MFGERLEFFKGIRMALDLGTDDFCGNIRERDRNYLLKIHPTLDFVQKTCKATVIRSEVVLKMNLGPC